MSKRWMSRSRRDSYICTAANDGDSSWEGSSECAAGRSVAKEAPVLTDVPIRRFRRMYKVDNRHPRPESSANTPQCRLLCLERHRCLARHQEARQREGGHRPGELRLMMQIAILRPISSTEGFRGSARSGAVPGGTKRRKKGCDPPTLKLVPNSNSFDGYKGWAAQAPIMTIVALHSVNEGAISQLASLWSAICGSILGSLSPKSHDRTKHCSCFANWMDHIHPR